MKKIMKLYEVSYFGWNSEADELFRHTRRVTDKKKAISIVKKYTDDFKAKLNSYLYPERVTLYTHVVLFEERDGEFIRKDSGIYSSTATTYDEETFERKTEIIFNKSFSVFND